VAQTYRRRHNLVSTTLGAALATGATSITFATALKEGGSGGSNIATLGTDEFLALTIENEVVYLTAYTAGATSGTIVRAREHTVDPGVDHPNGTAVTHASTIEDSSTLEVVRDRFVVANAKDDEFLVGTMDAAWTKVDYANASAITWTPGQGVLSAKHTGGDAAQGFHAQLKSMSGLSSPVTIETSIRMLGNPGSTFLAALVMADGTTAGSGTQVSLGIHGDGVTELRRWTGFNAFAADLAGSPTSATPRFFGRTIHFRLTWVSANTWRGEISPDGRNWIPFNFTNGQADGSATMTPTQMGVWCSTYGSGANVACIFDFDHFRVS
jgi:hypothetical protein